MSLRVLLTQGAMTIGAALGDVVAVLAGVGWVRLFGAAVSLFALLLTPGIARVMYRPAQNGGPHEALEPVVNEAVGG